MLSGSEQATTVVDLGSLKSKTITGIDNRPPNPLYFHFIFSANTNFSSAAKEARTEFYKYMKVCAKVLDAGLQVFGAKDTYIHLLVSLDRAQTPFDFIQRMKLLTAARARRNMKLKNFRWINADVSTVSQSERKETIRAIRRQTQGPTPRRGIRLVIA